MKKTYTCSLLIIGVSILSIAYFFVLHPYIIQAYDIWMGFNYPSEYSRRLGTEWQEKSSTFLYKQLQLPNSKARKGLALGILSERQDKRVLPVLKNIILKGDSDLNFQASRCLVLFGTKEAVPVFMEIINKYKNIKFYATDKETWKDGDRFFSALYALAQLKYEPVFPIIISLAKNGTDREKLAAFNGALYYYDKHKEEVLPLYLERLKTESKYKSTIIESIAKLKCPEAIPALRDLAEKEPWNRLEAEKAISYLKSLKANLK